MPHYQLYEHMSVDLIRDDKEACVKTTSFPVEWRSFGTWTVLKCYQKAGVAIWASPSICSSRLIRSYAGSIQIFGISSSRKRTAAWRCTMARDDAKKPRLDIRNDHRPIHREHHSPRGNSPLNLGSFTRGSQRVDPQKLLWLQGTKLPLYVWLGVFAIAYSRSRSPYRPYPAQSRGSPCVKKAGFR